MRATALLLQRRAHLPLGLIALVFCLLFFAVLSGAATAIAGTFAVVIFGGVVIGGVALMMPLRWLLVVLVILSFVITGQLIYFARIDKAFWFPFLLGAVLLVRFPLDSMQRGRHSGYEGKLESETPTLLKLFIGLYLATVVASTAINASPLMQVFVSSKEYFFLWGVYLICAAGLVKPELVGRVWNLLPWLMLLQLPLVFYQRFVVMASRSGTGAAFDAVVGAFGGNPMSGGASGAMGIFCVIGIVTVVGRWRSQLMPGWQALLLASAGVLSIALAEIKFMVILLPIAFALLFIRELRRKPVQGLLLIGVGFILALGVLFAYKAQYGQQVRGGQTTGEYFERMFKNNTDTDFVNMQTRQIGRVASIVFWYHKHDLHDPARMLLGHGAGSSREGALVVGEAQKRYAFQLTRSAIGILLWETGLIGTLSFVAMLGSAYLVLLRQSGERWRTPNSKATTASMAVAVAMLMASIPYDVGIMTGHQQMLLLMLCLGYAAMMNGQRPPKDATASVAPVVRASFAR